jgi:hypothetical protein
VKDISLLRQCSSYAFPVLAQVEISDMQQEKIQSIEKMRQDMVTATDTAALTVMGLANELAGLERCYRNAKTKSLKWERVLATTKNFIADNELTTNRLLDSIQHLYNLLSKRAGDDIVHSRENPEAMLDYIKEETEILQKVVRLSQQQMANEKKSLEVDCGSSVDENKKKRKPKKGVTKK